MKRRGANSFVLVAVVGLAASLVLGLCSNPAAANTVVINSGTATYTLGFVGNSTTTADPPPPPPAGQTPTFTVPTFTAVNVTSPPSAWGQFGSPPGSNPWIGPNSAGDGAGTPLASPAAAPYYLNSPGPQFASPQGYYYYTTTFTLSGGPPYSASGTVWTSDNQGLDIFLNGFDLGQTNPGVFTSQVPFTLPSADFVTGTNSLTFVVWNENYPNPPPTHASPTGVNIMGSITSVPEPATFAVAMTGLPVLGVFWAWRRRRRC
jgi:MYXO-CTERM domain-containing protein